MSTISSPLCVDCTRVRGSRERNDNITVACGIATIIETSFGPLATDKLIEDETGRVVLTNDGATILRMLNIEHPVAHILVDLVQLQYQEIGDGTTSVVLLTAEFLKNAEFLASVNIHPNSIISSYRLACNQACRYIQDHLVMNVEALGRESAVNAAKTALYSKTLSTGDADFLADMVVRVAETLKNATSNVGLLCAVNSIHILKARGASIKESVFIPGIVLNCSVASPAMPRKISDAKIACLDFSLQKCRLKLGVQVVITDPDKLEKVRQRELAITKEKIQKILNAGATVILCTGGIDELSLSYLVKAGVIAVQRCKAQDLLRIARATGAVFLSSFANVEGDGTVDANFLGEASEVFEEHMYGEEMIIVRGPKSRKWSSIILRSRDVCYSDEIERSLHNALFVAKKVLETQKVVAGGGSIEAALSTYLENFATSVSSSEQLTIAEYARALLVIPKMLVMNAVPDVTDVILKLRAYHSSSQAKQCLSHLKWYGLNIDDVICDNIKAGVIEPATMKIQTLKFATEAAITILRINSIRLNSKKKKKSSAKVNGYGSGVKC